ncbi:MAG: peptidase [Pseudomonadota bacterium]
MAAHHVVAARGWLGTPYIHQASAKGAGCDCLGLVRGIWRETLGAEPFDMPAYTSDWSETGKEEVLWEGAKRWLVARDIDFGAAGEILLFRMRASAIAKHLGIVSGSSDRPTMIHALSERQVVEVPLTPIWQSRVVAQFAFPERNE